MRSECSDAEELLELDEELEDELELSSDGDELLELLLTLSPASDPDELESDDCPLLGSEPEELCFDSFFAIVIRQQ